jgi:hypothetical protein
MSKVEFDTIIKPMPDMNAAFVEFPFSALEHFGSIGRIKIKALFDNKVEYRGLLAKMDKDGCHLIGLNQEIRKALNKKAGDEIHVSLEKDVEERTIEIPYELGIILESDREMARFFNGLSFTNRKEYVRWITEPKRQETKTARLNQVPELLANKVRTPYKK